MYKNKFFFIFFINCIFSQAQSTNTFKYSDTTFTIGQTKRISELHMSFSHPIYSDGLNTRNDSIIDSIYVFLKSNPTIKIELISHTDSRGSSTANLTLSQKRAESIQFLLTEKGIKPTRIIPIGKGESEPIFTEDEINKFKFIDKYKYEKMHATNRRTIIKITSIDLPKPYIILDSSQFVFRDTMFNLVFDSLTHNFGDIKPINNRLIKHFKYIGTEPIFISRTWTTDPHFICEYPKELLMPNTVYSYTICFYHQNGGGIINKKMGFNLSDGNRITIHFKGQYIQPAHN